ncbi:flagellar filament outer layer protein FlaA [Spirochaetota bacterium]
MKRILILLLIAMPLIIPGYTQDKKGTDKTKKITDDKVYQEIVLEDFETAKYGKDNIKFRYTKGQQAALSVRNQYPSPAKNSKKYLGVKLKAKLGDFFVITPAGDLIIDKYCKSLAVWVYGKRFSGQLSLLIQDANKKNHRVILGTIDFLGWRKLIVKLPKYIKQQDEYLSQKRFIKIMQIQYRPGNQTVHPRWQYFYIDDITAMVRDKYTDRQSDDW